MVLGKNTRLNSKVEGRVRPAGINGSAGRIYLPKKWIGQIVIVMLKKDKSTLGGEK